MHSPLGSSAGCPECAVCRQPEEGQLQHVKVKRWRALVYTRQVTGGGVGWRWIDTGSNEFTGHCDIGVHSPQEVCTPAASVEEPGTTRQISSHDVVHTYVCDTPLDTV